MKSQLPRIAFWIAFLAIVGVAWRHTWEKADPLRNHPVISPWWMGQKVRQLGSRNPRTAVAAWNELERVYLTKWSGYDWIVWRVKEHIWKPDDPPIFFRLQDQGGRYHATAESPVRGCRTVNEALMAMLHQEPLRRTNYAGDWRKWWDANWTYFPNRERKALPSGPEAPARRR